jgi:alkanesulfonate monooxygenase SsuD/methylene tetrahydromethanopterin reductase-like flavin-dependent oxidoreductase (luciferase family)
MHFGIEVVPFGDYSNPRLVVELAQAAENAGWEALWIWDHVHFPYGTGDPWITLSAVATSTRQLKIITGVAPLPRYRPHLLARMLTGLDLLSDGRVIFGTGLGIAPDFLPFGEPGDDRTRAEMLNEGLDLLTALWSGEEITHNGRYYTTEAVRLSPTPFQKPRIPIWIGGESQAALRRAARWDGWIMGAINENSEVVNPPAKIAHHVETIRHYRRVEAPFDVAVDGVSQAGETSLVKEYAEAGATWWFECLFGLRGSHKELLKRINEGPPA